MKYGFAFFPGQGAQHPGMGQSLFDSSAAAHAVFEHAGDILHEDIAALCFMSKQETLSRTEHSQLAIFTHSMAALAALQEEGVSFSACAGFSLGEYTALTAAGVWSFEDGLRIVQKRGQLMQQAADEQESGMAAVLSLPDEKVEEICAGISGIVLPVNYNCPGQLVIAGEKQALAEASEQCKAAGARRVLPLAVSGAFHTPLMTNAAAELRAFLQSFSFHAPSMPIYTNLTGDILQTDDYPAHLEQHMISPVRWTTLVQNGIRHGLTTGCEIGPGKTLCGFVHKISKEMQVFPVETMENVISVKNATI